MFKKQTKYYTMRQFCFISPLMEIREFDSKAERGWFLQHENRNRRGPLKVRKAAAYTRMVKAAKRSGSFPALVDMDEDGEWFPVENTGTE